MTNAKKKHTIHKKEIIINKSKLKEILDNNLLDGRGLTYSELYERVVEIYGLDLSYKGFMSLLQNKSTWKLLYAYAIAQTLSVSIMDIFELIDVDTDKVFKDREKWKEKYQK